MESRKEKGVSSSLMMLREAANEIQREEKDDIDDAMFLAADQIAQERGLDSPLRRKKMNQEDMFNESGEDRSAPIGSKKISPRISPRLEEREVAILKTEETLDALFKDIGFVPKNNLENDIVDDVDALLKMHEKKEAKVKEIAESEKDDMTNTAALSKTKTMNSKTRDRYLQRLDKSGTQTNRSKHSGTSRSNKNLDVAPSKIAILLTKGDEREWGDHIRKSFSSATEELLFRNMKTVRGDPRGLSKTSHGSSNNSSNSKPRPKSAAYNNMRSSTSRLSTPSLHGPSPIDLKVDPTLRYSTLADAKECTFRPQIAGKSNVKKRNDDDDGRKEDSKYAFISRQEADERSRREELEFSIGKAKYDALIDKKTCPECGAKQSYDEVKDKRKLCPNCRVEYCNAISWGKVSQKFFKKGAIYAQKAEEKLQRIKQELEEEFHTTEHKIFDKTTGKVVTVKDTSRNVWTPEQEAEFFHRLEVEKENRQKDIEQLTKELYDDRYPFHPTITRRRNRGTDDSDSDTSESTSRGKFEAFIKRVDEDMEYRREILPAKYLPIRKEPDHFVPFKVSKPVH